MKSIKKLLPILMTATMLLSSCGQSDDSNGRLKVYASFYAMNDFVKTVGGVDVVYQSIVPVGVEAHDFEPTAADMSKLNKADVFVYNGMGMESWAEQVADTLPEAVSVVCTSDDIPNVTEGDPHVWLSFENAKAQIQLISEAFAEKDTENAQNYNDRATAYISQIDELANEYKNAGLEGKKIFVTHGAYSYLCDEFGMEQIALEGISGDSDPSPAQMAKVIDEIKAEGANCIFYDPLEGDKMAQAVAKEANVEALPLCTFEGDSEHRDYITVMKDNLEQLKKGLN